jgi:ubiquinone/menaquinone biosynthesis C-methylase UbiE
MQSNEEMIDFQAKEGDLINADTFKTKEDYTVHLIHESAYRQAVRLVANKTVLDLGCNTGYGTGMLATSARKVVGVDVSKKALEYARSRYGRDNVEFKYVDGLTLPFEDRVFDIITSFQVIEHIVDYNGYLSPLKRVLKEDGFALFTTPNGQIRLDPGMKPWNKFHVREFSHIELKELLGKFFKCVKILGLDARDPLRRVEVTRVQIARENARKDSKSFLRRTLKKYLPESIQNSMKALIKGKKSAPAETLNIDQIFYRDDKLEQALDYIAICSNDEKSFEKIWKSILNI